MNTYRNPSKKTSTLDPQHNTNKKDLLRVRVYAKIERLRQRIYNWETNHGQWEEDLKFVDKHQENMDNDETYYPHTNSLIEMNNLWLEYYDRLNPNNFEYNKFSDIIDE
jgi:hypothetical protein